MYRFAEVYKPEPLNSSQETIKHSKATSHVITFSPDKSVNTFLADPLTAIAVKNAHTHAMKAVMQHYQRNSAGKIASLDTFSESKDRLAGKFTISDPPKNFRNQYKLLHQIYQVELASQLQKTLWIPIISTKDGFEIPGTEQRNFNPRLFVAKQKTPVPDKAKIDRAIFEAVKSAHQQTKGGFTCGQLYQAATRYAPGTGLGVDELKEQVNKYLRSPDAIPVWRAGSKAKLYASRTVAQAKEKESQFDGIIAIARHSARKLSKNLADRFQSESRQQEETTPQKNRETHTNVKLKHSRYQGQKHEYYRER